MDDIVTLLTNGTPRTKLLVNRAVQEIQSLRKQLDSCRERCNYYKDQTERLSLDLGLKNEDIGKQ